MFRALSTEEASHVERWQAPRIGEPAPGSESVESLLPSAAVVQEAYDEGYAKGLADAEQQSRQREVDTLMPVISAIQHQVKMSELARSDALMDLSRAMAELILHREIREDPDVLTLFVKQAIDALDIKEGTPEVRLHPEDLALLCKVDPGDSAILWTSDDSLPRGSCILDSGASRIQNGIAEQLARVIVEMDPVATVSGDQGLEAA